ncbi:cell surface protein SprA [bacterium]|nr:cell surface protein SprA [bacterium]
MHTYRSYRSNGVGFGTTFSIFFFIFTSLFAKVGLQLPEPYSPLAPLDAPKQILLFYQGDSLAKSDPYYSSKIRHEVTIDSTCKTVTIRMKIQERDILFPKIITFEDYIRWRIAYENQQHWKNYAVLHITSTETDQRRGGLKIETPRIKSKAFESIFGGNTMSLTVNGNITIDASMRNEKRSQVKTAATRGSNTNFQMKQTQRFKVEGKIGENLSIFVDQDSERPFEFENAIKLRYTSQGEDGIVKSIQAGNVSLSLPGTRFVTVSAQNAGLFGIKSELKVGPLDITAIASMEKGQKSKKTFEGGTSSEANEIDDYDYIKSTYFFLDYFYRDQFAVIDPNTGEHQYDPNHVITDINVYLSEGSEQSELNDYIIAWATLSGDTTSNEALTNTDPKRMYNGYFRHLTENEDYYFDAKLGFIQLNRALMENQILAVAYQTQNREAFGHQNDVEPDFDGKGAKRLLKMIRPRNPQPSDSTWNLEWRHAYSLRGRNINKESFELKLFQKTASGDPKEVLTIDGESVGFLHVFGLDNFNKSGSRTPDNSVDNNPNFLNLAEGVLIFPDLRPFDPDAESSFYQDHPALYEALEKNGLLTPSIYDTTNRQYISDQSKFFIEVKSSSRSATFNLGMNVIEGSEEVILNGRRLTKDVDYSLEPFSGTLTMLNEDALDPTAKLEISYENQQLFTIDKKTLLGMRAEYTLWESGGNRSFIGGTLLYLNQKTLDRRVRVGQDAPMRNVVWDINTAMKVEPAFIDRALDAVSFIHSSGLSSINFEGEMAQIVPNPNTLNNEDTGDRNGVAYLDDFEGSRQQITLSIMDKAWRFSGPPDGKDLSTRGHMIWYNPWEQVPIQEIWPEREVTTNYGNTTVTHVLDMVFYPNDTLDHPADSWYGIQQGLSTGYFEQTDKRFLELWIKGDRGRLNIALGRLSEDAIPNEEYDTEDLMDGGIRNDLLDDGEDVGLDGVTGDDPEGLFHPHETATINNGAAEPYDFWDLNGDNIKQPSEPWSYDNWQYSEGGKNYDHYNGTENSAPANTLKIPDTEDLNNNGYVDYANDYFKYSISLPEREYMAGGGESNHGWYLYRIPLNDYEAVGNPDWTSIEFIRLWLDGVDPDEIDQDYIKVRIAEISLTGNEWKLRGVVFGQDTSNVEDDSTLTVSVINNHDNPDYDAPKGVSGVEDPVYKIKSKEQSLVLTLKGLAPGTSAWAEKIMMPEVSILDYKVMKMFVHGGGTDHKLSDTDSVAFILRLGSDKGSEKKNYYEIEIPRVHSGWDDQLKRNYVKVYLDSLSRWKNEMELLALDSLQQPKILENGHRVRIAGRPTLTRIAWIRVGVKNNGNGYFSDEIWLNELRVSNVRKDKGMAYRVKGDVAIGDLFRINGEVNHKDSDFHTVNERFGQGATSDDYNWSASFNLHKFLPSSWGISLPVTYNERKNESLPKFKSGSDIFSELLTEAQKDEIRNKSKSTGFSTSISKRTSSRNFLVKYLIDPISGRFSISKSQASSSTIRESENIGYQASAGYKLNFSSQKYVEPLKWLGQKKLVKPVSTLKFYYLPNNLNFDVQAVHSTKQSTTRDSLVTQDTTKTYNQTFSTAYQPFKSMNFSYNWSQNSDLRFHQSAWNEVLSSLEPGEVTSKDHSASATFNPTLSSWLRPNFKYNVSYRWSNNLEMLRKGTGTSQSCNKNASISVSGNLDLKKMVQSFSKKRGGRSAARSSQRRPRPPQRNAQEQSDKKEPEKKEEKKPFPLLKIVGFGGKILERIEPISVSYNTSRKANHNGILGTPSLGYRFDMSQDPEVNISENVTQPATLGDDSRWSVRSGFQITSQITAKLDYSLSNNRNKRTQETESITQSVLKTGDSAIPFPNWTLSWRGLEKLPLINKVIKSASLNHNFSGQKSLSISDGDTTAVTISKDFRPLIGLNVSLKNELSISMQYNTSESIKEQKSFGSGDTKTLSGTVNISVNYKKRGGLKLPFMKGKKLDNNIDFSMTYSSSNNSTEVRKEEKWVETRSTSNWSLKPKMSYTFSRTVQGGLYLEFGKRTDKLTGDTSIKAFGLNTVIQLAGR